MAVHPRYQGSGSSHINARKLTSAAGACPDVRWVQGCLGDGSAPGTLIDEAVAAARRAGTAVVFAGLPPQCESEASTVRTCPCPRATTGSSKPWRRRILTPWSCSPAAARWSCPWADKVRGILYLGLSGEAGGEAAAELLFGDANPGGKLAESWPLRYSDCVCAPYYGERDPLYREGLYVGYRHYASAGIPVRFPFGHGLSYTSFAYSDLAADEGGVSFTLTNTGAVPGAEVAQLYFTPPESGYYRPRLNLCGFARVQLAPGESRRVRIDLDPGALAVWTDAGWRTPGGTYRLALGSSSEDIRLEAELSLAGDALPEPPGTPGWYFAPSGTPDTADFERLLGRRAPERLLRRGLYTMENTLLDIHADSRLARALYRAMELVIARASGWDRSSPEYRMMLSSAADASLSGMQINGGVRGPWLRVLLELANGRSSHALARLLGR